MRKFLTTCLSVTVFALAGMVNIGSVSAEEPEEVSNVADLKSKLESDKSVKLSDSFDGNVTDVIEINTEGDLIIDLNGKTLTGTNGRILNIKKGNVIIQNGTIKNENTATQDGIIYVYGSSSAVEETHTHLTLAQNLIVEGIDGVVVSHTDGKNYGTIVDINGTIKNTISSKASDSALVVHGNLKEGNVVINVTGSLTGLNAGVFQSGVSTINLNGANVSGYSGVVTKSGALNVNGAKVQGTGAATDEESSGNGFVPTGAGIQIESNKAYTGNVDIKINGGEVTSDNNSAIEEYLEDETDVSSVSSISVLGNAILKSSADKKVISASESFNENNANFIAKGTVLSGNTEGISNYLSAGLEIGENGKVIDPKEVTSTTVTGKGGEKNPKTGDNVGLYFILAILGLGVAGVSVKKVLVK